MDNDLQTQLDSAQIIFNQCELAFDKKANTKTATKLSEARKVLDSVKLEMWKANRPERVKAAEQDFRDTLVLFYEDALEALRVS